MTRTGPTGARREKVTRFLFNPCDCCWSASPAPCCSVLLLGSHWGQEPQLGMEEEEEGSTKAEVQHCLAKLFLGGKTVKAYSD